MLMLSGKVKPSEEVKEIVHHLEHAKDVVLSHLPDHLPHPHLPHLHLPHLPHHHDPTIVSHDTEAVNPSPASSSA